MPIIQTINSQELLSKVPITVSTECRRKETGIHMHSYLQLAYALSGSLIHTVKGVAYDQVPGSCVIIPPYTEHSINTTVSEETPVIVFISFSDKFLTDFGYQFFSYMSPFALFENRLLPTFTELSGDLREKGNKAIRNLCLEYEKHENMSLKKIASGIASFFRIIATDIKKETKLPVLKERADTVSRAVDYISKNFEKKITIKDLCEISATSRSLFIKEFEAVTGTTPAQFIIQVRIQRALCLMVSSLDYSLDKIAKAVGFYDKSSLSHAFKKVVGKSPCKYRAEYLSSIQNYSFASPLRQWSWCKNEDFDVSLLEDTAEPQKE